MNNKGQFSVIAALLFSIVLISTVIITYSNIRTNYDRTQPQILSAIDETNLAIKNVLGFTVGYYCSILKVTGNSSYAKALAINYLEGGMVNIVNMHPEWGSSFKINKTELETNWYTNSSFSRGDLLISYNLTNIGIYDITYQTSSKI